MRSHKQLLLWSSIGVLVLLVGAAFQENFLQEWRSLQKTYRQKLSAERAEDFNVQLRQVVVQALATTDRCTSCHVSMAPGETGVAGDKFFKAHPDVVHDPSEFGCVVCHGGQGRATKRADAHGDVPHWPKPMLPKGYVYAGCGSCHTHLAVPNLAQLIRGRTLIERYDCLACHGIAGRGGTLRTGKTEGYKGTDLTQIGAAGWDSQWYKRHLERHESNQSEAWRYSFGPISKEELRSIEGFLSTLVGAPGLVEAKAVFHSLGCRGCHIVGGVGGDDGPDLTQGGERDPARLDFTSISGEENVARWLSQHFKTPARIVPDSKMPYLGLSDEKIERLTFYMLSLRRSVFPEAFWPKDRIRAERFREREFATDGATLYGTFCAACHGPKGQGMQYPGMMPFPAVSNPDFLSLASDSFISETIRRGRPGSRMPTWGEKEGGLRAPEIEAIVAHLRSLGDGPSPKADEGPPHWVRGSAKAGSKLFGNNCAGCHGKKGEGLEGPALANPVFLETATDTFLVETIRRGRRGTAMRGFGTPSPVQRTLTKAEIEDIVAFIRTWEKES
jgi:mono/diheme cytochrome c family protein